MLRFENKIRLWNAEEERRNRLAMEYSQSQGASSVYSSPLHTDCVKSPDGGLTCSEEPVPGTSQAQLAHSPASNADSLHCMALDSDFSDVDEDFGVDLKSGHQVSKTESGPLLRANKVSTGQHKFSVL